MQISLNNKGNENFLTLKLGTKDLKADYNSIFEELEKIKQELYGRALLISCSDEVVVAAAIYEYVLVVSAIGVFSSNLGRYVIIAVHGNGYRLGQIIDI